MYFSLVCDFINTALFSLACFLVRIQYIIHITQKICFNRLLMLPGRFLVNSRLLVLGESKVRSGLSSAWGIGAPDPLAVQGSTVPFYLGKKGELLRLWPCSLISH